MNHCSDCGSPVVQGIPAGDNRERHICPQCGQVHYLNPKLVSGCVPQWRGQVLLCRRAIQPRRNYWTIPAGFLELGESLPEAAAREALEEACTTVKIGRLFAMIDVVEAGQVHVMYSAHLVDGTYGVGEESLEVGLFDPDQIPWRDLAFPSVRFTLERFVAELPDKLDQSSQVYTIALGSDAGHNLAGWSRGGS